MTKSEVNLINDKIDTLYEKMKEVESRLKMVECPHHDRTIEYILRPDAATGTLYIKQCRTCAKVLKHLTRSEYNTDRKQFLEQELEKIDKEINYDQAKD